MSFVNLHAWAFQTCFEVGFICEMSLDWFNSKAELEVGNSKVDFWCLFLSLYLFHTWNHTAKMTRCELSQQISIQILHINDRYWVIRNFANIISVWHFSTVLCICHSVITRFAWMLLFGRWCLLNHYWRLLLKDSFKLKEISFKHSNFSLTLPVQMSCCSVHPIEYS